MHPEDIKAAIRKRGTTMSELSLLWGFSDSAVRSSLKREMPKVEIRVAKFLGKELYEVWPDRYTKDNIRIRHLSISSKSSEKKRSRQCKKNTPKLALENVSEVLNG